nr:hypothetical protein [uncultured Caproiciproducens sp.]
MCFIKTPNLPESDVALVAMSGTYPKIQDALSTLGVQTILTKPCKGLSEPVCSHADMLCHHLGHNQMIVASGEEYLKTELENYGFKVFYSNKRILDLYPGDVILNCARIGDKLIANRNTLDDTITDYCNTNRVEIIPTNQGYAKCSTVIIDSCSIITADSSIAEVAVTAGIETLKITPGHVNLKGYEYGFLGGACGMIGKGKLAFSGDIKKHPDYYRIKCFCDERNVELISLNNGPLTDVGGILPLKIVL